MKTSIVISILTCLSIISCTSNKNFSEEFQDTWSLTNVSGGIAGLNCDIDMDIIIWEISETLIEVTNNSLPIPPNELCSQNFKESSSYEIVENGGDYYLEYDNYSFGLITIEDNNMTINGTFIPNGEVSDAYSYQFNR